MLTITLALFITAGEERQRSEKTLSGAEDEERVDGVSVMSFFLPYRPAHRYHYRLHEDNIPNTQYPVPEKAPHAKSIIQTS